MKFGSVILVTLLAAFVLLQDVSAQDDSVNEQVTPVKKKHHKKHHRKHKTTTTVLPSSEGLEIREESYFDRKPIEDEVISRKTLETLVNAGEVNAPQAENNAPQAQMKEEKQINQSRDERQSGDDPCSLMHCGAGRECEINEEGETSCTCIKKCPQETEERRKVCTNYNETWSSDCEVYQRRCQCEEKSAECGRPEYAHVHIEYYGECRAMPECQPSEMADFPRRMREWLFQIMRDLADRDELSAHYMDLQKEAEGNLTRRWNTAAVWKFCDLDEHPQDRSISRHELFPIRAPLMALEHCIAPFLNKCDGDDDHLITLKEWARCLELNEDDIEEKCDGVNGDV